MMIQGSTREDRHRVTSGAALAVGDSGGCVLDFKQFSNLAICLTIELSPAGFIKLRRKLTDLKVTMDQPGEKELSLAEAREDLEISCTLKISFVHEEPDLRIQIPAVPG